MSQESPSTAGEAEKTLPGPRTVESQPAAPPGFEPLAEDRSKRMQQLRQEALATARAVAEQLPETPEGFALVAVVLARFGQHDEAADAWRRCLQRDEHYAEAFHGLGTIALEKAQHEEAVDWLQRAVQADPNLPEVRPALADALMNLGRMEEAVAVLRDDINRFPQAEGSRFRLAQALLQLERYEEAKRCFEETIRLNPQSTYAYYGLANACRRLGLSQEAAKHLETFRRLKQADRQAEQQRLASFDDEQHVRSAAVFAHEAAGGIYFRHGLAAQAERQWLRAVQLAPERTGVRGQLALLYQRSGRLQDALAVLEQMVALEPENPVHRINLGTVYAELGRVDEAEQTMRKAISMAPGEPFAYVALAQLYLRRGTHVEAARQLAEKAVELAPSAGNWALLCAACQKQGDLAAAAEAIEQALQRKPNDRVYRQVRDRLQKALSEQRTTERP